MVNKNSQSYYSTFYIDVIAAHPDLNTTSLTMDTLSSGSYDIVSQSGISFGSITSQSVITQTYINQSVIYQTST